MHPHSEDLQYPGVYGGPKGPAGVLAKVDLVTIATKLTTVAANTEVIVFDSTMIKEPETALMDLVLWTAGTSQGNRRIIPEWKGVFLSVFADQDLQLFYRHLAQGSTTWRGLLDYSAAPASPTAFTHSATNATRYSFRLTGDDHQIVLKTGATPPTVVELSLRLTADYFASTN